MDPKNPETNGQPTGLTVTSYRDTVILSWDRIDLDDLTGFQIYRKSDSAESLTEYSISQGSGFTDTNVAYGTSYTYAISALGNDFESARSDCVSIEPGPTFNWAFGSPDNFNLVLFKYTHDFRHEIHRTFGFLFPIDLEIDYQNGQAWVLDEVSRVRGQLVRVSSEGDVITPLINLINPIDIEIQRSNGVVWVSDAGDSTVKKFSNRGAGIFSVGGFVRPTALAVDQVNGSCWVADAGKNEVIRMSSNGLNLAVAPTEFEDVVWLAVDSNDGAVWVVTENQLIKLNAEGIAEFTVGQTFNDLQKVEVNQRNGDVWVIGWAPYSVYKFTSDGALAFEKGGFAEPADLSINEFDNSCVVSDTGIDEIVKISADGENITTVQEVIFPKAIAVQNEAGLF